MLNIVVAKAPGTSIKPLMHPFFKGKNLDRLIGSPQAAVLNRR
jgi:hypothetical protein